MIQVIYSGAKNRTSYLRSDDTAADATSSRTKMITIRLTEQEREQLNLHCLARQISVQNYVRAKLGLPADLEPREKRRGRRSRCQHDLRDELPCE